MFADMPAHVLSTKPKPFEIKRSDLLKMKSIVDLLKFVGSPLDYSGYSFTSFDLCLNISKIEYTETAGDSLISEKQRNFISKAPMDTKLYFEKIVIIQKEHKSSTRLPTVIVKLKE